jgi:hypothetical protein
MAESFVEQRKRELGLTSSSGPTVASTKTATQTKVADPKESDFVTNRKIALGLIPDPKIKEGNKQAASFKRAEQNFNPMVQDSNKPLMLPSKKSPFQSPDQSPLMEKANQFVKDNPTWKSVTENPIVRGAEAGLKWVQKPFEAASVILADTVGQTKNLLGSKKRVGYDGKEFTSTPSQSRDLGKDLKGIISQTNENVSSEVWKNTMPNLNKLPGTGTNVTDIIDFGAQSISPTKFLAPLKAVRGLKAAEDAKLASQAMKAENVADYSNVSLTKNNKPINIPEPAQAMKQGWFSNLFGDQGIGISAVKDTKRISKDPLTTEGQIVTNSIKNDAQGIKDSIAAKAREVYQNHVDQLSPLKTISNKTYDSAMDSARSNNIANTIVHDKFVTPEGNVVGQGLGEIFKKVARGTDSQFIDYLTLRHSVTRMERGEQVYADSLNMTPAKAQERLSVLEQRYPGFKDIAKEWDGFNNNVLQHYGVNEGLISENAFNALREKNPNYSPMNRQFSRSEKPGRSFIAKTTSSSFSGQKAPIKEVSKVGSARNIVDPRKSTIENVGAWVNASMRNRTMQSMVDAIKVNPESFAGVAEIVQKPKGGVDLNKVLIDGGADDFVETLNQDFSSLFKKSNVDGENVVRAMVKGEPVYIKVHDPEIVKTLIGMGPQASNILIDAMSAFSNATKRGATGLLSPVFAVKGATMDLVQSAIQAKNPAKQAAYTVYAIFSGIGDKLNIPGLKNMAEEFRRTGGEYSAILKGDRKLNKSVSDLKRNPILSPQSIAKGAWNTVSSPFKVLGEIGNIAENAPRIAASKLELNRLGGQRTPDNVRQAMSAGREATVNFSRKGAFSRDIEAFVPYNNAAIQGSYRIIKGLKENPVRTAGAIGTLAVLPKLYEYAQFHDDPDYQNLPARERMRFLIVNKNADGSFTKIPMDPAYNSIGEMTIEALRHFKDNDPTAFKDSVDALANAWTPPFVTGLAQGITQGTGVMGSLEGAANATVGAPAIAAFANKSFTGAPIESAAVTDRSPRYRYDEKTSSIAKKIGEVTAKIFGEGFSPMKADYIMRAYGGDPARLLLPLTSDVGPGNVRNTLLKNFIVDPAFTNTLTNDFYRAKEKLSQAFRDSEEVAAPLPKWFDQGLYKRVTSNAAGSISKQLSILSADKKDIVMNKSLKSTEKASKLRKVQEEINKIYLDINSELTNSGVPMN